MLERAKGHAEQLERILKSPKAALLPVEVRQWFRDQAMLNVEMAGRLETLERNHDGTKTDGG